MNNILQKTILDPIVKRITINAPDIAKKAKPGQFIMLRINEYGERIPLTIVDWNRKKGTIDLIFQEVGKTTIHLGTLEKGDAILDLVGPLGKPSEIKKYGTVLCIGGGLGIANMYCIARSLKKEENKVITTIGARSKDLLFLQDELSIVSSEIHTITDDGTSGRKGLITELVDESCKNNSIDAAFVVGPVPMMKAVCEITKQHKVKTLVSLDAIMLDGIGMCGTCRVEINKKVLFACVDGPEFDAKNVDFDELLSRQQRFCSEEQIAKEKFIKNKGQYKCQCKK